MQHGEAGAAAQEIAQQSLARAEENEERARRQRERAERYAAGAAGEQLVASALAPLSAEGWHLLHDRDDPNGGNIDHIVVGPGSIIVIDTKAWNGDITVKNNVLRNNGWNQMKVVQRLHDQRDAIQGVLGTDGPIDTAIVLPSQPELEPLMVDGTVVLGSAHVLEAIRSSRTSYTNDEVEQMAARLIDAFPISGTTRSRPKGMKEVEPEEVPGLFDKANRFFYLSPWKRFGHQRVYMCDSEGEDYGYKDLKSGTTELIVPNDALAGAVLSGAQSKGLTLSLKDVPKLPVDMFGGRLLSIFGKFYMTAFVGYEWKRGDHHRLYGTLVNPAEGIIELGHVDIPTGLIKPAISGPVARDRGPAERYLGLLRDRMPRKD